MDLKWLCRNIIIGVCIFFSHTAHGSHSSIPSTSSNLSFSQQQFQRKANSIQRKFHGIGKGSIGITYEHISAIIPTDLQATNDGGWILDRILSKTGDSILRSQRIQNSFLFKRIKKIEKSARLEVNIKSKTTGESKKFIEHQFRLDVQAFQGKIQMSYSGYVDSHIEYKTGQDTFHASISEKLSKNSKLALVYQKDLLQRRQMLQYQRFW